MTIITLGPPPVESHYTVFSQVVNDHDFTYPPPIDYVSDRILSEGVNIVTDPGFLACCDCTDNCQVTQLQNTNIHQISNTLISEPGVV
jgi:hypothetical protein